MYIYRFEGFFSWRILMFLFTGKKGKYLLYFLVGSRVLNYLAQTVERERALTAILRLSGSGHNSLRSLYTYSY